MKEFYDLIVLGAGASGLMAASVAGLAGKSVLILERAQKPAEKIYVSGGGKCNFTNLNVKASNYFSSNPHFCKSALAGFTPQHFISFLQEEAVLWQEREAGKLFAFSGEAIRLFLLRRAEKANVEIRLGVPFFKVEKKEDCFLVSFQGYDIKAKNLLVATGGLSYPTLGATGVGFSLAEQFGIKVIEPKPALVSLLFGKQMPLNLSDLAGISLDVSLKREKKLHKGALLFTKTGFSGPVILDASLYWKDGEPLTIDFLPEVDIASVLKQKRQEKEKKKVSSVLCQFMPQRLAERFALILPEEKQSLALTEISDKNILALENVLKRYTFIPEKTAGWQKAEVTKGGVDTKEVSSTTLESLNVKGLYFSGEVLDVTGQVGGFNLHWAWASGFAVGKAIADISQ